MSASKLDLTRNGQWVSGPSTLMSVLGLSRAEVVNCRMVRWLFDPLARHGIGVDMIRSLADYLDITIESPETASVETEIAIADTRADIVLTAGSDTIVFEAKIDAAEQDQQGKRIETHWPDADPLIFLTAGRARIPHSAADPARWRHLSWLWIAETASAHTTQKHGTGDARMTTAHDAVRAWADSTLRSLR
ncbi:PD-(D/E)XK nuclease family protein [Aquihabitans sp. McL0605]|uniref:PD-(D/E)XK nuclease family protein n=1 Tax=Aquihabitans sp. McL0605 TaxID=3415671 RepID=UPI003CE9D594